MKLAYLVGVLYLLVCCLAIGMHFVRAPLAASVQRPAFRGNAGEWFNRVRASCNPVEVETEIVRFPPPDSQEGQSYSAACYALAGKIDRARAIVAEMPERERRSAALILFEVVHPIADTGDDNSAGPTMSLVLDFDPDNELALYHAGMAEFNTENYPAARKHLQRFLELHETEDALRDSATRIVKFIN